MKNEKRGTGMSDKSFHLPYSTVRIPKYSEAKLW